jgi:D-beta-D-heptose 7-phosphate kinase/D-beta-D-heptose 1-phosphate adenosyltransferase
MKMNSTMENKISGALEAALSDPKKLSVLVVGDLMLDEYLYGAINRISPEAPVGILNWSSLRTTLGGAANVAHNLAQLDCKVFLVGLVGQDQQGEQLLQLAQSIGIHTEGVAVDPARPTTVKTRIISHGHQVLRIDREVRKGITELQIERLVDYVKQVLPRVDGIILSDYAKGVLEPIYCSRLISLARAQGLPILVDPKGEDFSKYRGVSLLTPNKKEVKEATRMPVETEAQLKQAVTCLFSQVECDALLITRSEDGMSLYRPQEPEVHIKADVRDVFDVTGAGDTVISMLGRVLFAGHDWATAAQLANIAAGIKVGKLGTAGLTSEEVIRWLQQKENQSRGKLVGLGHLKQLVSHAQSQGRTVVFTNGCFELLHTGHVQLLQNAKALGHILVVAINDDSSVREIKGDMRPLITAADRARIIGALQSVDYVTIFSDLTPLRLIKELQPDVLVKGGDYKLHEVVGWQEVEEYGGRVQLIPVIEGQSTSNILRSIEARARAAGGLQK